MESILCAILHYAALEHGLEFEGSVIVSPNRKVRALLPNDGAFDMHAGADLAAGIGLICRHIDRLASVSRAALTVELGTPLARTRRRI